MPSVVIAPSVGFLPLRALTPCKWHDAFRNWSLMMAAAGGCACVVAGLRCLRGMRAAGSLTRVSFFLRNVPGWAAAADWGWGCVLNPVGLKQPPVLRRPQISDLDVLTWCLSLFASLFKSAVSGWGKFSEPGTGGPGMLALHGHPS